MKQDSQFTLKLQEWMNTPDSQKDWAAGALLLLQLSGNRIMYHNLSINPKGKAEFIKGQLQKYLNFRLQQLTHDEVEEMQQKVDEIVKDVIKPDAVVVNLAPVDAGSTAVAPSAANSEALAKGKSEEFAEFKAGKRADHDLLPVEIQALYVENLDIINRMRELHLKLRTLSLENTTCPDSERYPFLKEIIALDKRRVANWDTYDHYVVGTTVPTEPAPEPAPEPVAEPAPAESDTTEPTAEPTPEPAAEPAEESPVVANEPEAPAPEENATVPEVSTEGTEAIASAEAKPKMAKAKTATKRRTNKKSAKKA